MKKFKIAIDVSPLSNGNSQRGVGYYTRNLIDALQTEIKSNPDYQDFSIKLVTDKSELLTGFDLIHYPYFDPFFLTLPTTKTPYVVSVHDLIPLQLKKLYPTGIKGAIKWLIQKYRVKKAKYLITISHTSKYILHDILGYPKDKIFNTYLAADPNYKVITNKKILLKVKEKYQLPNKFVLYLGDVNLNKNVPRLAQACAKLKISLIIAGSSAVKEVPQHPWTKDIIWVQQHQSKYLKSIGFVDDADKPAVYNLATVYCQPSLAEGFGLPLLEAMQCGTPTCFAVDTAQAEISDYSGLSFDPYSVNDIAQKIKKIITDKKLSAELKVKGLNRAKYFSWKQCALSTLAVYRLCQLDAQK